MAEIRTLDQKHNNAKVARSLNGLTAIIVAVGDTWCRVPALIQESTLNETPQGKGPTGSLVNSTDINTAGVIPGVTERLVRSVELWVFRKFSLPGTVHECVRRQDAEGVTISSDIEHDLVDWHASGGPCFDSRNGRTLLINGRSARIIQRSVRSDTCRP